MDLTMVQSKNPLPPLLCMLKQRSMPNGEEISRRAEKWRQSKKRQGYEIHNFIKQDTDSDTDKPVNKKLKQWTLILKHFKQTHS